MELKKYYIKTVDNNLVHEVIIYDDLLIKVNTNTKFNYIINKIKEIYSLLKDIIKTNKEDYQEVLHQSLYLKLVEYNNDRLLQGELPIDVEKEFKKLQKVNTKKKTRKKLTPYQKRKKAKEKKEREEYNKTPKYIQ